MAFVQFSKVSLAFGERDILKDVSINLQTGTKAALAGANGSGKSTLMKVLAGITPLDNGERAVQKDTRIAYLPQSGIVFAGATVMQEVDKAFAYGYELSCKLEELGEILASDEYKQNDAKASPILAQYHEIQTKLEESNWYHRQSSAEQVLVGLGFTQKDFNRSVNEFSGGWQMRIALAKVLLSNPHIMLLDEPTNYLDIEARTWLLHYLADFKGGFLLVSHDRYFLDETVTEVYELFGANLRRYTGNYTHYEQVREAEIKELLHRYDVQQQEIKKLEDFIRRFGAKATKAAQAQERMKMLEKIERIEIPENLKKIHFTFPPAPHSGRLVLTLENLGKTYRLDSADATGADNFTGDGAGVESICADGAPCTSQNGAGAENVQNVLTVIKDLNLVLEKNERLVVAGRNGAGKTTLLRIIAGTDTDFTGTIKLGAGVSIGYFSQDSAEQMTGTKTVLQTIEEEAPFELQPKVRDMLGAFLFRGDDVFKQVAVLSGGEKSRLALLRLLLRPVNLLVLDEPTNHLDLSSKDVLLKALQDFGGTVLFVSHDRFFIEALATRVLELKPGSARAFAGDYRYYLDKIENENLGAQNLQTATTNTNANNTRILQDASNKNSTNAKEQAWADEKKKKNERRKLEREEERLLNEIASAEEEKSNLDAELAKPAIYSDVAKCANVQKKIDAVNERIAKLSTEWEEVCLQLESAQE